MPMKQIPVMRQENDAMRQERSAMRQEKKQEFEAAEAARRAAFVTRNPSQGLTAAQRAQQQIAAAAQRAQGMSDIATYRANQKSAVDAAKALLPDGSLSKTDPVAYEAAKANMSAWRSPFRTNIDTMQDAIRAGQTFSIPAIQAYNPNQTYTAPPKEQDFKKGGSVTSPSKRCDGIAQRGKTKGRMI